MQNQLIFNFEFLSLICHFDGESYQSENDYSEFREVCLHIETFISLVQTRFSEWRTKALILTSLTKCATPKLKKSWPQFLQIVGHEWKILCGCWAHLLRLPVVDLEFLCEKGKKCFRQRSKLDPPSRWQYLRSRELLMRIVTELGNSVFSLVIFIIQNLI